jgi:hypothetical protein
MIRILKIIGLSLAALTGILLAIAAFAAVLVGLGWMATEAGLELVSEPDLQSYFMVGMLVLMGLALLGVVAAVIGGVVSSVIEYVDEKE